MKHKPFNVSRPVRQPMPTEYDHLVAKDLCRRAWGVDWNKCRLLPMLPLFFVAVDGYDGMAAAQQWQQQRGRLVA